MRVIVFSAIPILFTSLPKPAVEPYHLCKHLLCKTCSLGEARRYVFMVCKISIMSLWAKIHMLLGAAAP